MYLILNGDRNAKGPQKPTKFYDFKMHTVQRRKWSPTANEFQTGNDPEPQMTSHVDRKWSRWKERNGMEFVLRVVVSIFNISIFCMDILKSYDKEFFG